MESTPRLAIEIPNPSGDDGHGSLVPFEGDPAKDNHNDGGDNGDDVSDDDGEDDGGSGGETGGAGSQGGALVKVEAGAGGTPSVGQKRKRNLPGTPDPDAEVVALSPRTLLATNRFVCEICNKGFQRDQNLQLHRRGHNLPWKLRQRTTKEVKKKVYICPEPTCIHHDPSRALGDLTGIKKHFCRKHGEKKYKCDKCSKRYAVQSDWKAHLKTCGTREYRCDCGTLFSRRDSFITHRAFCDALADPGQAGSKADSADKLLPGGPGPFGQGSFQQGLQLPGSQPPLTPGSQQGGLNLWSGQNPSDNQNDNGGNQSNPLATAAALMSQQLLGGGQNSLLSAASSKLGLSPADLANALSGNSSAAALLQQRAMQVLGGNQSQGQNSGHVQSSNSLLGGLDVGALLGSVSNDPQGGQPSGLLASLLGRSSNAGGGGQGSGCGDGSNSLASLLSGGGFGGNSSGMNMQAANAPANPQPNNNSGGPSHLQTLLQQALGSSGIKIDPSIIAAVANAGGSNSSLGNNTGGGMSNTYSSSFLSNNGQQGMHTSSNNQQGYLGQTVDNGSGHGQYGNTSGGQGSLSSLATLLSQTIGGGGGTEPSGSTLLQRAVQRLASGNGTNMAAPAPSLGPGPPQMNNNGLVSEGDTASLLRNALNGLQQDGESNPLAALSSLFPQGLPTLNINGLPATGAPEPSPRGNVSTGAAASGGAGMGPTSSAGGGNMVSPAGMSSGGGLEYLNNNGGDDGGVTGGGGSDFGALASRLLGSMGSNTNMGGAGGGDMTQGGGNSASGGMSGVAGLSELLSSMTGGQSGGLSNNIQSLLAQVTGGSGGSLLQSLANNPGLLSQIGQGGNLQGGGGGSGIQRAQSADLRAFGTETRDFLGLAPNMSPRDMTLAALGGGYGMQQGQPQQQQQYQQYQQQPQQQMMQQQMTQQQGMQYQSQSTVPS